MDGLQGRGRVFGDSGAPAVDLGAPGLRHLLDIVVVGRNPDAEEEKSVVVMEAGLKLIRYSDNSTAFLGLHNITEPAYQDWEETFYVLEVSHVFGQHSLL